VTISASADLYDALAPIYDEWQGSAGMTPFAMVTEAKLAPRLERLARGGALSFLDLGCGTGTLLCGLRATHPRWRLAGVDGSAAMLANAARKPEARTIAWARAPLEGPLPIAARFDAAGAFYDALNHLPDGEALGRAFGAAAHALRSGGWMSFDVTNQLGFDRWWRGTRTFTAARWRIVIDAHIEARGGRAIVTVEREHDLRRFELRERVFEPAEIEARLVAAGFQVEAREPWSPFDLDVPGKTWWTAIRR